MCCKIPFVSTNFECDNNQTIQTDYLVNNKYYRNGVYFGDIIYSDLNKIQVECKNGNKYMDGQIITINFMKSNTILEFKIGRGGHFNNPGHLSYVGETKGISHTDAFNCLFQPLYKNGNDDFRKKIRVDKR